ncbi:S1 family peptidase [Streptomyces sp. NPDC014733]|uniref:S1 family peptidase n=1 Tax=Streptomyces sp. NPDC014733 TaxID=3364885 RepID=UPI0036FE78CF
MHRRHRTAAVRGAAAAVVLAAVTPLAAAHAAPPPDPSPQPTNRAMLDAMRRDLGLTPEGARARLAQETEAARAAKAVRQALAGRAAGMWFDKRSGKLVVAVTGDADARLVKDAGAVAQRVTHSRAQLTGLLEQIDAKAGKGVPGVTGWGVDERANALTVRVDTRARTAATDSFVEEAQQLGAPTGIAVHVVRAADAPRRQGGTVVGGEKWTPGEEGICSIGFSVTGGGRRGFLTAGHCTETADQPAYGKDGSRMGTSNRGGTHSVDDREGDFGLVDVDQPTWKLSPDVAGQRGAPVAVTGAQEGIVGTSVCRSGEASGWHCGEITAVDQTVDYDGGVIVDGLSFTDACSAAGDSGGSYVTQPGDPKAVGIHSGGGTATCSTGGDTMTVFQPVEEALTKWQLTLTTAGS